MTHLPILLITALMCLFSSSCLFDVDSENEEEFTRAIEAESDNASNNNGDDSNCDAAGDRRSCNSAGFCEEDDGLFTCNCDVGYTGPRCRECEDDYERMGGPGSICIPQIPFAP